MKRFRYVFALFLAFLMLLPVVSVNAQTSYVYDEADLLTETEEAELQNLAQSMQEQWDMNFLVVTTSDAKGKSAMEYADDFYDTCFPESSEEDGVCYLIDMDHREIYLSTCGIAIRYLTDQRIENVLDAAYEKITEGDYYGTFTAFFEKTENYLSMGIPKDQYNYDVETGEREEYVPSYEEPMRITFGEFLFALIAALAAAGITVGVIVGRYQLRFEDFHYDAYTDSRVDLTVKSDRLTNTFVTHRRIPKNNGNSGGGGSRSSVHTSSSGRSHGGGGRSF